MFDFLKKPREDVRMIIGGGAVEMVYNHRTKVVLLYDADTDMPPDRYAELEKHLAKRGYLLQVVVGAVGMPIPGYGGEDYRVASN